MRNSGTFVRIGLSVIKIDDLSWTCSFDHKFICRLSIGAYAGKEQRREWGVVSCHENYVSSVHQIEPLQSIEVVDVSNEFS